MADPLIATDVMLRALEESVRIAGVGVMVCDQSAQLVHVDERARNWLGQSGLDHIVNTVLRPALEGARVVKAFDPFGDNAFSLKIIGAQVLSDDSSPCGAVAVLIDNSQEKFFQVTHRELVANVGHELKTPIGAMGLLAETLVNESDPEVSRKLGERLSEEAMRAGHVVDDLLALGHPQGEPQTDSSALDLCEQAVARLRPAAESHNIDITIRGEDALVRAEAVDIVSALHHLVDNAIKYSASDTQILVEVMPLDSVCEIAVSDHGIGIPAAHLDRIFERFYRIDAASSRTSGGTGLGLAIVKHAVERNGGNVRVESTEGSGSKFTLRLKRGTSE